MNQIFIIFLLIILIIGVLYYYIKKEDFTDLKKECLYEKLEFNTTNKSKPFNEIFTNVYKNSKKYIDTKKYITFMNPDFIESHQEGIASFLGLREGINLIATKDYQHYVVKHNTTVSFTSPINKYLEIIFNNFDNIPFVKITYNHTEKKCVIEHKLPDNPDLERRLIPRTSSIIDTIPLPNGLGNKIEFVVMTLRKNGVIHNQFRIIINSNLYCYNLLPGIEKHFYNALKNITIYASGNTFTISHNWMCKIYTPNVKAKIESRRVDKNVNNYVTRARIGSIPGKWFGFSLVVPNADPKNNEYAVGSYLVRPGMSDMRTDPNLMGALILKEGDYVKPSTSVTDMWDNKKGGGSIKLPILSADNLLYTFFNANDRKETVNGTEHDFIALGGDAVTQGNLIKQLNLKNVYLPLALVRRDCLQEYPNGILGLWNDTGSGAARDGSIWTYNHGNNKENKVRSVGSNLVVFNNSHNIPEAPVKSKKWIIKESCLLPQPQLLTDAEKTNIEASIKENINKYLSYLTNLKREKDAIVNINESQMNESTKFKTQINQLINNSKSAYDNINKQNIDVNDMQNKYNKHYDFINLLKDTITPINNKETNLYKLYSPIKIDQISSDVNNTTLSESANVFNEINNNFITNTKTTSDLVQQYNLQRDNDKILQLLGNQVSK